MVYVSSENDAKADVVVVMTVIYFLLVFSVCTRDFCFGMQVIAQLFSPDWESGTFEAIKTVTETYVDFFRDLHSWLSEYFFAKLARACYEKTLKVKEAASGT